MKRVENLAPASSSGGHWNRRRGRRLSVLPPAPPPPPPPTRVCNVVAFPGGWPTLVPVEELATLGGVVAVEADVVESEHAAPTLYECVYIASDAGDGMWVPVGQELPRGFHRVSPPPPPSPLPPPRPIHVVQASLRVSDDGKPSWVATKRSKTTRHSCVSVGCEEALQPLASMCGQRRLLRLTPTPSETPLRQSLASMWSPAQSPSSVRSRGFVHAEGKKETASAGLAAKMKPSGQLRRHIATSSRGGSGFIAMD